MCNWRAWLIPGLVCLVVLTALAIILRGGAIEADLTERSTAAMLDDGVPWVSISLDGRDVSVSGTAPTEVALSAAVASANRVAGVYRVDDTALTLLPLAEPYQLTLERSSDSITIAGSFPNAASRTAFLDAVRSDNAGLTLIDQTELARGAPVGFDGFAQFAGTTLSALATGTVFLDDTAYAVSGTAQSIEALQAETDRLEQGLSGLDVVDVAIEAPRIEPYIWTAEAGADGVTLSGFVPDEATRAAVLNAAEAIGMPSDTMQLGSGAPEGFLEAVTALLNQMAVLENASAGLEDRNLRLSGEAGDASTYQRVQSFLGSLPEGFDSLSGRIDPPLAQPFAFSLSIDADNARLSGVLPNETVRAVLLDVLEREGLEAEDTTTIARGAPAGVDLSTVLSGLVTPMTGISDALAQLIDNELTITGRADSIQSADERNASLQSLQTDAFIVNSLIEADGASPFAFTAITENDTIVLEGFVPSQQARTALIEDVAVLFPSATLSDTLQIAEGASDDFLATARSALRILGRLESGQLEISDDVVRLSGEALYEASIATIETDLQEQLSSAELQVALQTLPAPELVDGTRCQALFATLLQNNTILFETGSASIDRLSYGLMDRLVRTLLSCPDMLVEISGHTDSQGADSANQILSEARAGAVLDYVVGAGITADRLTAVGYGETVPVGDNDTEEGRAQNRRIEFTVQLAQ